MRGQIGLVTVLTMGLAGQGGGGGYPIRVF